MTPALYGIFHGIHVEEEDLSTMDHHENTRQETPMNRNCTAWKIVVLVFVLTLALAPRGMAQQAPSQRPHLDGTLMAEHAHDEDEDEEHEHGRRGREGRMGQHRLERLTQQLKLSDEQRAQIQTLMRNHAKDIIRLKAEIATMRLDLHALLEADTVDLTKVKQQFLVIAAKEVDLHMAHVTAMQEIRKLLTPEQQKQFKPMQGHRMREGGRR
jgi:Spy/CpxP family protein refolding chaperone